jgi:hypothetical protein
VFTALTCLSLLLIFLGIWTCAILGHADSAHRRIDDQEVRLSKLSGRVNTLEDEIKNAHAQLIDGIWQRASEQLDLWQQDSEQIDQEIERARARGRGF